MAFIKLLGRHIKDVVYGANDGIITTFAVVSSVEGANLGTFVLLAIGFASLFADGFSMAASDFLASKAEAARVLNEHGADHVSTADPKISASFTFLAFIVVGVIPLIPYFFLEADSPYSFLISGIATAAALFGVGATRTKVTGGNALRAGFEMLFIGGSAAAVAYFIGKLIEQWQ